MDGANLLGVLLGCGCRARCCCGDRSDQAPAGGSTLFHQSGRQTDPPRLPDDTPFIPPVHSWDSPQRPTTFSGRLHLPGSDADGTFRGEADPIPASPSQLLDDGTRQPLPLYPVIDHQERIVTGRAYSGVRQTSGLAPDATFVPLLLVAAGRPPAERLDDFQFTYAVGSRVGWLRDIEVRSGGVQERDTLHVTSPWAGGGTEAVVGTETDTGRVYRARIGTTAFGVNDAPGVLMTELRIWEEWQNTFEPGSRTRTRHLDGRNVEDGVPDWQRVLVLSSVTRPLAAWGGELRDAGTAFGTIITGNPLEAQVFDPLPAPSAPGPGLRWRSPDGAVTVTGPLTGDPADLTGATLTAWGTDLTEGSWTALRDTPVWDQEAQVWRFDRVILLHEAGGPVTALRPGVDPETISRAVFEAEILRVPAGSFRRFTSLGAAHHSWPPQWAMVLTDTDTRALTTWDAWRDARQRRPTPDAQPPHWYWPARPRRRPEVLPLTAPRAPLGLTLADVLTARDEEALPRGAGPLLLPTRVELWREKEQTWEVSEAALAALSRRIPYAPAGWPDELDDRVRTPGRVRITYPDSALDAVLLIRALLPARRPVTIKVNGTAVPVTRLGHNADARGWQPALLRTGLSGTVYELDSPYALTRALLLREPDIIEA
ncbi:hypothetical protein [Deinococcus soli (ex Cha et al. 2016)]|uniref:hypothetical protein n=3 Tax=Deinococcus soli (ex Cha et al. 2016) TaxID=1309411 RepID=UPI0036D29800